MHTVRACGGCGTEKTLRYSLRTALVAFLLRQMAVVRAAVGKCRGQAPGVEKMDLAWWHWIVLGLALGLLELAVASFFIVWFGLGALLVGAAMLVFPAMGFATQVLWWTVASVLMTVLWFKVFRRDADTTRAGQPDEALGEIGILVQAAEPLGVGSGRGEVRFQKPVMGSDVWPCIADEAIGAGERVKVLAVDGQLLKVGKY